MKQKIIKIAALLVIVMSALIIIPITYSKYVSTVNDTITLNIRKPEYRIDYYSEGVLVDTQDFVYGTPQNIKENTQVISGKYFDTWNTNQNGTGTDYEEDQEVNNLSSIDGTVINLYAIWKTGNTSKIKIQVTDENTESDYKTVTIEYNLVNITDPEVKNQYSLDNGTTWQDYTAPFVLEEDTKVMARTVRLSDSEIIGQKEKNVTNFYEPVCNITISRSAYDSSTGTKTITITYTPDHLRSLTCVNQYSLDNGVTWNTYTGPFTINTTTEIKARCILTSDSSVIGEQDTKVWVGVTTLNAFNGATTLFGIHGVDKASVKYIGRTTEDLTLEDIQERINNGENLHLLNSPAGAEDFVVYGWLDSEGNFYWWSNADIVYFASNTTQAFRNFYNAETIDMTGLDTSQVTDFSYWFHQDNYKNTKFAHLIGQIDTSSGISANHMFYDCQKLLAIDTTKFHTSNMTDMQYMFATLDSLTSLDVSMMDTSQVQNMRWMFRRCHVQDIDISNFDTSNVTDMFGMFVHCTSKTIRLGSGFDTSSVTIMENMFYECKNLTTIYACSDFDTTSLSNSNNMFDRSVKLVGGNGTTFSSSHKTAEYAKIDRAGTPGYFTDANNP